MIDLIPRLEAATGPDLAAKDAALRDAAEALDEAASDIRKFAGSAQRYLSGIEAGEKANKAARKARGAIGESAVLHALAEGKKG